MKVIYMTARPPYPPHKGDQLIAWEQLKHLKVSGIQIYLLTFVKSEKERDLIYQKLSPYCKEIIVFPTSPLQQTFQSIKTLYNLKPVQVNLYYQSKIKQQVLEVCERVKPDVVHVQTARLADYFIDIDCAKCIDMIDALSLNMKRRSINEKKWLKPFFLFESHLMRRHEKAVLRSYEQTILVSENDKHYLNNSNIVVNPNGTYITKSYLANYPELHKRKTILFHGNMQYYPNVEAVVDFVKDVWPIIHQRYPDYQFHIVGKDPVKSVVDLHGKNNVVVTGFVEDICSSLMQAKIGIYPMKSGTGMQNKILESMACGLPTIASPIALQGIGGITGEEVIRTESKEEMVSALEFLIEHPDIQEKYAHKGQSFVWKNYSWSKNCTRLTHTWEKAMWKMHMDKVNRKKSAIVN
ncbi:glycosyltransferase [Pontibacillus salicampi]|uniref:Glycosyltransferase n=1 Tax=Pontibacillus salicampi TaxID=1449801 RepID=A0ABV6LT93_9BACI